MTTSPLGKLRNLWSDPSATKLRRLVRQRSFLDRRNSKTTACLITDVRMPGMSGVELQGRLIADGRSLPTVFISAFSDETVQQKVLESGAVGYLHKPFDEDRLIACIDTALKSQSAKR